MTEDNIGCTANGEVQTSSAVSEELSDVRSHGVSIRTVNEQSFASK